MSIAYDSKIGVSRYEHLHGRLVCYIVVQSHDDFPGVEISISGGVAEMVRGLTTVTESSFYRLFTPSTLTLVTHNSSHTVL